MVTVNSILGTRDAEKGAAEFEFKGLSTDTKPTGVFGGSKVGENSLFLELDTGDAYYLNGGSWKLYSSGEGGGSGAGLPEVTSEDNGKVLGVVNGAWGKMELQEEEDTYETVLEMQLGEPITGEGIPEWATAFDTTQYYSELESLIGDKIYIKTEKTGDTVYPMDYSDEIWTNNVIFDGGEPELDDDSQHGFVLFVLSAEYCIFGSDVELSNTTLTILKKVSGGGSDDLIVTVTSVDEEGEDVNFTVDTEYSEIVAAANAKRNVRLSVGFGDHGGYMLPLVSTATGEAVFAINFSVQKSADPVMVFAVIRESEGATAGKLFSKNVETKPASYTFDFTVTGDAQNPGQYICTPGTGTSYSAITAALSETPNVYAKATISGVSGFATARFDEVGDGVISAKGLIFIGTGFMAYRLRVPSTGELGFVMKQLANET